MITETQAVWMMLLALAAGVFIGIIWVGSVLECQRAHGPNCAPPPPSKGEAR